MDGNKKRRVGFICLLNSKQSWINYLTSPKVCGVETEGRCKFQQWHKTIIRITGGHYAYALHMCILLSLWLSLVIIIRTMHCKQTELQQRNTWLFKQFMRTFKKPFVTFIMYCNICSSYNNNNLFNLFFQVSFFEKKFALPCNLFLSKFKEI